MRVGGNARVAVIQGRAKGRKGAVEAWGGGGLSGKPGLLGNIGSTCGGAHSFSLSRGADLVAVILGDSSSCDGVS